MPKRKSPDGISTNDLVFSAHVGTNNDLFPSVLKLCVPPGSKQLALHMAKVFFGEMSIQNCLTFPLPTLRQELIAVVPSL